MRDKYDFEKLVYQKANTLSAKERRYVGYRKAINGTAAVFAVLIVGSVFALNSLSNSFDMGAEYNAVGNGAKNTTALNEGAAAANEYDGMSADFYDEEDSVGIYNNGINADDYDVFENSAKTDEKSDVYDKGADNLEGLYKDRVVYECEDKTTVIVNENIFGDFKKAVNNLEEIKTPVDSEESLFEICIIENSGQNSEYRTNISVYSDALEITYEEYTYNENGEPEEVYAAENKTSETYYISDEFISLVRENFDENFTI